MVFLKSEQDERLFQGWASVAIKDSQGETIPMEILKPQMEKFMARDAPIMLNHSNWKVGKLLSYDFRPNSETGKEGMWVKAKIHKHFPIDDDTWNHIDDGTKSDDADVLNEMSIAGQFEIGEDGVATWAAPMEISLTGPAVDSKAVNPAATIEEKTSAKSISTEGDGMEKSQIDEQINKKKSEIDEKLNQKKADFDAEAEKKKAEAEKEAEEEKKKADEEIAKPEIKQNAVPPAAPGGAVAPPAQAEAHPDEAQDAVQMKEMFDSFNSRLMKIEQTLDSVMAEEENAGSTDANLQRAEQKPGAGASATPSATGNNNEGAEDKLAHMSKELARLSRTHEELVAKFSKLESTGMRRMVQSGAGTTASSPEEAVVREILGEIPVR